MKTQIDKERRQKQMTGTFILDLQSVQLYFDN